MTTIRNSVVFMLLIAITLLPLGNTVAAAEDSSSVPVPATQAPALSTPGLALPPPFLPRTSLGFNAPLQPSFAALAAAGAAAQRGRYRGGRGGYGGGSRNAAAQALLVGAAATIAGAAVLAYANRPDCDYNQRLMGCGYGTKVVGTSVLAGGLVGVLVGAALWR